MKRQQKNIEQSLKQWETIKAFEASEAYALLIEPLKQELSRLRYAYDCKSLHELATLKGKRDGLMFVMDLMNHYMEQGKLAKETERRIEDIRMKNEQDIDSTTL